MSEPTENIPLDITSDEILETINTLGALVVAISPGTAAAVALAQGTAQLIDKLVDSLRRNGSRHLSVAEQAALKAWNDAKRLEVGAPPSTIN